MRRISLIFEEIVRAVDDSYTGQLQRSDYWLETAEDVEELAVKEQILSKLALGFNHNL